MKSMKAGAKAMSKGAIVKEVGREARDEAKGMLGAPRKFGSSCHSRGQEDRHLHHPWPLQDQDPCEASHQGRNQEYLWQGCEGEGEASQDRREGLRSRCAQVTDLRSSCLSPFLLAPQRLAFRGNPMEQVWAVQLPCRWR